ncbi:hypothetical protein GCM10028822_08810 [Hymenobacter terrigena]
MHRIILGLSVAAMLGLGQAHAQSGYQSIFNYQGGKYPFTATEPLYVVLPEPMPEPQLSKSFKNRKPALLTAYLAEIAAQRTALELATKQWHLSPVSAISNAQAQQFALDKQTRRLVLTFGMVAQGSVNGNGQYSGLTYGIPALLINEMGGKNPIGAAFPNITQLFGQLYWPYDMHYWQESYPSSEMVPAVQQLQAYAQQRATGQSPREIERAAEAGLGHSAELLPSRTLLLSRNQLSKSLTEATLAKVYPHPVQVVDQAGFDAAVAAADARYVYVRYVTLRKEQYYQLVDASNGKVLGWSKFHASHSEDIGHLEDDDVKQLVKTATGR